MGNQSPAAGGKSGIPRFRIGLNVAVQIAAMLFIIAAVNYYGFKHFKRWDFSRDHRYELSGQTRQVLENLKTKVKIYEFFTGDPRVPGGELEGDIEMLLREYQYAARGKVEVESINPYRDMSRARDLMAHYKVTSVNVVVVDYQGKSKTVNATDMADYDETQDMTGEPPKVRAFRGEQIITAALLDVLEDKQKKVYLISGKGGPELAADDVGMLKTYLEQQNLKPDSLALMNVPKVPDDAAALMLIGARYDLTDRELKLLKDYWNQNGRIFIALNPDGHTPRLAAFLEEAGIEPQDDRVLRLMPAGNVSLIMRDVEASFSTDSPVTKRFSGVATVFLGVTQSLALSQPAAMHTEPLVTAAEGYWGETKYQDMENTGVEYDPKEDISAPLTLAASAEKGAVEEESVKMDTARMIVTGNADFISSAALQQAEPNVDFLAGSLNWLVNREELIGITPKAEEQFSLNITDDQLHRIEWAVLVFMPLAALMLGAVVRMQRRR